MLLQNLKPTPRNRWAMKKTRTAERAASTPVRDIFYPRGSLEKRDNFKRYFYVACDGPITERIFLHILDKRHREMIVCTHFLQFLALNIFHDEIRVNILSRDDPWDFTIELSNGVRFSI